MSEEVAYQAFDGEVDNEESLLRQTQQARVRIVNNLMASANIHEDLKALDRLDRFLNAVDKQVLTKQKIKAAEKNADANQDLANGLNAFLMSRANVGIKRHDAPPDENTRYQPPIPNVDEVEAKDGELAPVGEQIDVTQIMSAAYAKVQARAPDVED